MTETEEKLLQSLYKMTKEIYHHLGLDGQRPISFNNVKAEAQKDILKWKNKRREKNYVSEKSS